MSYEIIVPQEIPSYITSASAARIANEEAAAGISTGMPARLKLAGKQFVLVDGAGVEAPVMPAKLTPGPDGNTYLRVVILRAKKALNKTWFASAFNPNEEGRQPDCFSLDGERPSASSLAAQSETCAACPHNAFGSGKDQSGNPTKGKACADKKILAVYIPGAGEKQVDCIFSMALPAASLKNFGLYVKKLSASGIPLGSVLTLVGFDLVQSHPVMVFQFGGFLPETYMPKLAELSQSLEVEEIIGATAPALPAPVQAGALPAAPPTTPYPAQEQPAPIIDLGLDDGAEAKAKEEADKKAKAEAAAAKKAAAAAKKKADEDAAKKAAEASAANLDLGLDFDTTSTPVPAPVAAPPSGVPTDDELQAELEKLGLM